MSNKPSIGSAFGSILGAVVVSADAVGNTIGTVGTVVPALAKNILGSAENATALMHSNTIAWKSEADMKTAIAELLNQEVKAVLAGSDSSEITARREALQAQCAELFN